MLIAILFFFLVSWILIYASHDAAAQLDDSQAPVACSFIVAIIITIIGILIL